ncbi:bifunctional glycosyltransferase/CDP-glycerol:glycerophosphate glycerophosphotransferase [Actinomadura madurae]|uniref:bifunctional glycosyltransferase/CDP-glycerol:glycerophosphate glycerophosphotransferase n=1 Tax=Actinomadura madurae TaxID=1993 RepID=UPI0020D21BC6|nr:bifunctional glycosyltransferase family 2 protein/CDP-glycerol:glycerophosphate glycerophosphotransferase [Actinomadura madurae]MCP9969860.1 bifunctional glycosyltransferase family 2 protein/CDP-glycerol:glycerophosphate glycerophosphotransferase [Actinomadura madurae]MCP9982314.1 bifunctional glycosyltransferase family 2 protein/CDP-glycerol:glycerophosphate glycerophosphotransferase [Actinomadura madurae]MCQ0018557.1 bifunctional glycosyltransferase family 2 protein/CDP-glycerol:glycerophos
MSPQVSIVVPFHTTDGRLAECLESLAAQTLRDVEVLMVDDGSGDGGTVLAKDFAARDDRFTLVQPGPGTAAVDAGVEEAKGRYLAFADGEDALPPYACELLAGTLDSTGSDLAGGNVICLDGERVWQSPLHGDAYAQTVKSTHVTGHPSLLQDRMVWNKVYRRSFWDAHGFELGNGQDALVAVQTQVLASAVDVLDATVYFWRDRPGTATRLRPGPADITQRMATLASVRDFVREHAPDLLPIYDTYALDLDVRELMLALPAATWEERERLVELGAEVVADAGRSPAAGLEALRRLETYLLGERMLPELLEVLRFEENGPRDVPLVSRGRLRPRWYARYPFFDDAERGVPEDVYDVTDELALWADVDRVEWDVDTLIVEGHAHFDRLDVSSAADSRIRVWMRDVRTGKEIRLPVERSRRPEVTARSGQSSVSYDWSGFTVRVEPDYLLDGDEWRTATYELFAEVTTAGRRASRRLTAMAPAVRWTAPRQVDEHVAVQPAAGDDDVFVVHVKRAKAVVTRIRCEDDTLVLTGWTRRALGAGAAMVAQRRHGGPEVRGEVTLRQSAVLRMAEGTGFDFTAKLPLEFLGSVPPGENGSAPYRAHLRDAVDWDIRLTGEGGPLRLAVARNVKVARYALPDRAGRGREFALTRTAFGNLRGVERSRRPVVTGAEWDENGRLTLSGDFSDPRTRPDHLVLRRRRSGDEHRVPVTWEEDRFTAAVTPSTMAVFGTDLPLGSGTWDLVARTSAGEVAVVVAREAIPDLPGPRRLGTHDFAVGVHQIDALTLESRPALEEDEAGGHAQVLLQQRDYPVYLRSPLSDIAVFDSYNGSQYSCSPRAIYEELNRRETDLECVWVSQDGQFAVDGKAQTVLAGSREHYRVLARARYIVTNQGLPSWYVKREGQTYVQTWHGTPLKRLAYDLRDMPYQRAERLDWVEREVPRWDLLLSPSPYATQVMRRAFKYDGEVLETGYPRNDILSTPEWERIGTRIRKRLGIPQRKKVVLYAPTWRDDRCHPDGRRGFSLELDVETMQQALGKDHVLLLRTHHHVTDRDRIATDQAGGFAIDVSRYPDMAELYMAADVLITDYSSAMFDYAVLGRPIILYTYDLEWYRDHLRGMYFDLEAEAPGPVVRTSAQAAEAVRAAPGGEQDYADAYDRFFVKYCPHDDGQAASRAVDRLFGAS